jgi:hypothetical protein
MPRFGVLDHNQKDTDRPREYYDEAQALLLVRRQLAKRLNRRLIRRCLPGAHSFKADWPVNETPKPAGKLIISVDGQVISIETEGGLAPREVSNCFFKPPQSDLWREQHRMVTFLNVSRETSPAL